MLMPEQCRAARAWLDWGQAELAKRAGVGLSTLRDFEAGRRTPMRNNLQAMQQVLEGAGIHFVQDPAGGTAGIAAPVRPGSPP